MRWIALLLLVGCGTGGAAEGGPCDAGSKPACANSTSAVFCESGTWKAYDCGSGCDANADGSGRCHPSPTAAGQPCPLWFGACAGPDTFAICPDGKWLMTECVRCRVESAKLVCD